MLIAKMFRKSGNVMKPPMYVILRSECGPRHKAAGSANDSYLISLVTKDLKSKDGHKAKESTLSLALRFFGHYVPSE